MPRSKGNWAGWFNRRENKKNKRSTLDNLNLYLGSIGYVVGEGRYDKGKYTRSHILNNADKRRKNPTVAEKELETILNELGNGSLRGKFIREHVISGKWIVDFFFHEIRLAIEVDGSIHYSNEQRQKDAIKDADARRLNITVLRIANSQVFGNRQYLVDKLRDSWRKALKRKNTLTADRRKGVDTSIYTRKKSGSNKRTNSNIKKRKRQTVSEPNAGPGHYFTQLMKIAPDNKDIDSKQPYMGGFKKATPSYAKFLQETWGTREDYKKDRGQNFAESRKRKF